MTDSQDTINIPAYQRKRSIAAKARQTNKPIKVTRKRLEPIDPTTEVHFVNNIQPDPIKPTGARTAKFKEMKTCGNCEGYFEKIDVAIFKISSALRRGDIILIEKNDGLFQQEVKSMQINRKEVKIATAGSHIGMKVEMQPKIGGTIYKVL